MATRLTANTVAHPSRRYRGEPPSPRKRGEGVKHSASLTQVATTPEILS